MTCAPNGRPHAFRKARPKRRPFGIARRSLLALLRPHVHDLPCRFVQVHVVEFHRCVVVNGDAEGIFDIVERGSALNDVGGGRWLTTCSTSALNRRSPGTGAGASGISGAASRRRWRSRQSSLVSHANGWVQRRRGERRVTDRAQRSAVRCNRCWAAPYERKDSLWPDTTYGYASSPAFIAPTIVPSTWPEPGKNHSSGSYRSSLYL